MQSSDLTINALLKRVAADKIVIPSIQRSFVWKQHSIVELFDSLMRGYPIGSMLIWRMRPGENQHIRLSRLYRDFKGERLPASAVHPPKDQFVDALLDGQQRVTALNIGLHGTLAGSPQAPARRLYLDLDVDNESAGAEENRYRFVFSATRPTGEGSWFPVGDISGVGTDTASLDRAIRLAELNPSTQRRGVLKRLASCVNVEPVIRLNVEKTSDADRVLNIFARANMGSTKLTYVDLLVSTASSRLKKLDPSTAFPELRKQIAAQGFRVSTDRIVKASLVLIGETQPRFHVSTFFAGGNAKKVEDNWAQIQRAMVVAAATLRSFGMSDRTLSAENVLIPVATYAFVRKLNVSYATADGYAADRRRVRAFVARTLLQRNYWTGAVDPLLVTCRRVIHREGAKSFPLAALGAALAKQKPITDTEGMLDELMDLHYSDRRTLLLLTLLYPHMVNGATLHKDHIYPISMFDPPKLAKRGLTPPQIDIMIEGANRLPNLQLLVEGDNVAFKRAHPPTEWLDTLEPPEQKRYRSQGLTYLPKSADGIPAFWERRQEHLRRDIARLLNGNR